MLFEGTVAPLGGVELSGLSISLPVESPLLSDKGCLNYLLQQVPVQCWPSWAGLELPRALLANTTSSYQPETSSSAADGEALPFPLPQPVCRAPGAGHKNNVLFQEKIYCKSDCCSWRSWTDREKLMALQ